MGKNNLSGFAIGGVTLFLIGIVALVPFTNCSQNPQNASTPKSAFLSPLEKTNLLKAEFQGRISRQFCQSHEAYSCMKKVYSTSIESGQSKAQEECSILSNSLEICPAVKTFHFNSAAAQENCNGCQETYEYTEYSCHLNVPNPENVYPIVSTESSLEKSLLHLYNFCEDIAAEL